MARKFREFFVTLTTTVRLSPRVIRQGMSKQHTKTHFPLTSPEAVAEHIAFNMVVNGCDLSAIDGFANLPDHDAGCDRAEVGDDTYECAAQSGPKRGKRHAK